MNLHRKILALFSIPILAPCLCAQMPRMEHRFEGLVADAFMADDGSKVWTAEDGGRVRFRDGSTPWAYLDTPDDIQDTIRAIHFLPDPASGSWSNLSTLVGWIVGDDAKIYSTPDGGLNWVFKTQVSQASPPTYTSHLRDINFVRNPAFVTTQNPTGMFGILVGLHGMWRSTNDGSDFNSNPITLLDQGGNPINLADIELYAVDILQCGSNEPIIVAAAEPGLVFRNKSFTASTQWGTVMEVVWDVRDQTEEDLSVCGSTAFYRAIHGSQQARVEIWDIEFQRKCTGGPPLLVMVAGGENLGGTAYSSTDYGSTFVKECHECDLNPSMCSTSDYNPTTLHTHYYRNDHFEHLYGVAVFGDGSAVAGGYGGQHVVRNTNGVWEDRSQRSTWALEVSDEASLMFLNGAVSQRNSGSTSSSGKAFLVGQGGQGRSTTAADLTTPTPPNPTGQPGENWKEDWTAGKPSGWWRMEATAFNTFERGWRTGQNYHVARTTDGGLTWTLENVLPYGYHFLFHSIAISPSADEDDGGGVAVGQPDPRELATFPYGCTKPFIGQPKILKRVYDSADNRIEWVEPSSITWLSASQATGQTLRDVTWADTVATTDVYWACGTGETLLRSADGGDTWIQYPYPSGSAVSEFNALAFVDQDKGVIVGKNIATGVACAYGVDASSTTPTYDISPSGVVELFDVAFDAINNIAYAVGRVNTVSGIRGQVFSSTLSGPFAPITVQPSTTIGVEPCTIGNVLGEPALSSVAVATNGDLWVGGECGRVWRRDSTGTWEEIKSQTDGHILDMASAPDGYVYVTSMRTNLTGPGLVRWNPESQ